MIGQVYDRIFTQLARDYEFIIRNDELGVWLRIKVIDIIYLMDWLDEYMLSHHLNLLDHWIQQIALR